MRYTITALALVFVSTLAFAAHHPAKEAGEPPAITPPTTAVAPGWNGNLCEPDKATYCLGVQNQGHAALLSCLRNHMDVLTPDCRKTVADANMKKTSNSSSTHESHEANKDAHLAPGTSYQ